MRTRLSYFAPAACLILFACAEKKEEPTAAEEQAPEEPAAPAEEAEAVEDEVVPAEENEVAVAEPEEGAAAGEEREDQSELKCDEEDVVCPLYEFQEQHAQTAVENNDVEAVAKVLHQIEFFAPDPSWNEPPNGWAYIARRGAIAAEAGDMREARKACRECHRQYPNEEMPYRKMYETEGYRTRELPELPENAETTGMPDLEIEAG